mmetsp:Transcript_96508/g.242078  ORF Transcript_96508/g.242078 Transcript_96508/m.242078 type:complete len:347 (+) Transcript_96508:99-1139(+)
MSNSGHHMPRASPSSRYGKPDEDEDIGLQQEEEGQSPIPEPQKPTVPEGEAVPKSAVIFAVALYAACSSTLLVINKVAMHLVPDAPFILFCQFLASSLAVKGLAFTQPDMDIEGLKWEKAKPFAVATFVFYLCLLSNTQALKSVNVETVIVVRSCSPIAVALLERASLGRPLPSVQGIGALFVIAGGAVLYVITDKGFHIEGYSWLAFYFVSIVVEMVFVKFVVDTVKMSTWTRVYYNNTLSLPMALLSAFAFGESKAISMEWTLGAIGAVLLSCVVGVAISYAGFNLRAKVSATSFTVVGVVCKILTVLLNDVIWTNHSNVLGHCGLFICIAAGFVYEKVKGGKK